MPAHAPSVDSSRAPPAAIVVALVAAALFLPGLGAHGLVDPWEPHYARVSREMLLRDDWVHPHWREAWFFSKPPLLLWGGAAGLALAGRGAVEWGLRLPVALLGIACLATCAAAVERLASRRAGILSGLAMATAPFVALFARQVTPDLPLAGLSAAATLCLAVALLDAGAAAGWAYAGWVLLGLAVLAKGLLGLALPAGAILVFVVATGSWRELPRLRFTERVGSIHVPLGPLALLGVAGPWLAAMALFPGRDESGWSFVQRFWLHDHVRRLLVGAHVPTAGGGWLAYVGTLAVGTFPWLAAIPGGVGLAMRTRLRPGSPAEALGLLCALWAALGWVLLGAAATRYPHYVLPLVAPLSVLAALFLDRLLDDGLGAHVVGLTAGAAVLAGAGAALASAPRRLADLFTYDPRRAWPDALDAARPALTLGPVELALRPGAVIGILAAVALLGLAAGALRRSARVAVGALVATALATGAWVSWVHAGEVEDHWTQREAFALLARLRAPGDDPPVAWLMNWRGENFYGDGAVREVMDAARLREIAARPGTLWVVTEEVRVPALQAALEPWRRLEVAGPPSGRYRLVRVEGGAPGPGGRAP